MSSTAFARLPQALRLLRKRRGWTQRELAAAVGFTVKQVSAYETGRQRPRIETLERILEQLQASARVLAQTMAAFDERPQGAHSGRRPSHSVRDGRPVPAMNEAAASGAGASPGTGPTSRQTLRSLAKRLPALRLLADELALDVVAAANRKALQVAKGRSLPDDDSEDARPREAE